MAGHSHWAGIKHKKGKTDKARSNLFSKLSREITVAAKLGDKNPDMNARLRSAIQSARSSNMPKDNIQRAIEKSESNTDSNYENIRYEGFGPNKIAVIVETLTNMSSDSVNTAATIKESTTRTLDTLLVDKYRSSYEDIIINMNDWCDAQMLKTIVSGELDCKNGCDDKFMKKIHTVNDLGSFKNYLNKSMAFLDKQ